LRPARWIVCGLFGVVCVVVVVVGICMVVVLKCWILLGRFLSASREWYSWFVFCCWFCQVGVGGLGVFGGGFG